MTFTTLTTNTTKRIGLFGGTFDPFHLAHIKLIKYAIAQNKFDEILIIPVGNPSHKNPTQANFVHRCQMIKLALADIDNSPIPVHLCLADTPNKANKPNYSFELLTKLRKIYPQEKLIWMLGADSFISLPQWKNWLAVINLCSFAVFYRELPKTNSSTILAEIANIRAEIRNYQTSALKSNIKDNFTEVEVFDFPLIDISGNNVRELIAQNQPLENFLPEKIINYIYQHHLYLKK